MKKILTLFIPLYIFAGTVFDTPKYHHNFQVFNNKENLSQRKNKTPSHIKCRYICDKQAYKEQKIAEAVSFYKNKTK
jgi:hypothetical protein